MSTIMTTTAARELLYRKLTEKKYRLYQRMALSKRDRCVYDDRIELLIKSITRRLYHVIDKDVRTAELFAVIIVNSLCDIWLHACVVSPFNPEKIVQSLFGDDYAVNIVREEMDKFVYSGDLSESITACGIIAKRVIIECFRNVSRLLDTDVSTINDIVNKAVISITAINKI